MRKVMFSINGKDYDGYYIGIAGVGNPVREEPALIAVEDMEGNIYCVPNKYVKFVGKPVIPKPKIIDLKLMRNAIEGMNDIEGQPPFTLKELIDLAVERNIFIYDTEGFPNEKNKNDEKVQTKTDNSSDSNRRSGNSKGN